LLTEVTRTVQDPELKVSVFDAKRARRPSEAGSLPTGSGENLIDNRLGSGSDYTVFLNHLGIPVADLSFDGPYGVYHSIYDNHNWVATIGDPGFRYHVALVQLWGVAAMRLAEADVIPLDYAPYESAIAGFVDEIAKRQSVLRPEDFADVRAALTEMDAAARALNASRTSLLSAAGETSRSRDGSAAESINRRLMQVERALLDPAGIPDRPWFRHLIFAPKHTYAPELLLRSLAAAIRRAAAAMK
jgi:N-acetylated-alpha-linked acidic dipeptidase